MTSKFLVDSNVFIQAKNFHYQFSFCESFWILIAQLHEREIIYSTNKVKDELLKGKDDLAEWARTLPSSFWKNDNEVLGGLYEDVINTVTAKGFKKAARDEFAEEDTADAWLIAMAKQFDYSIISHEKSNPHQKRKIYLADVALLYEVRYWTIFEFLKVHCCNNFQYHDPREAF